MSYVVDGRMIGGFGVIAVPAEYGVSGIQTFLASHAGTVYQRNLGPDTARIARGITAFDPGPGWEKVEWRRRVLRCPEFYTGRFRPFCGLRRAGLERA